MEDSRPKKSRTASIFLFVMIAAAVFIAGLFAASIIERRAESASRFQVVKQIADWEPRNEVWGENYPREYETYRMTLDTNFHSKFCGSGAIDYLAEYPELVVLWAGYSFAREYNQGRGHAHAIEDIRRILRTGGTRESPQPATCWTCKSTDVPRVMASMGPGEFYSRKWIDMGDEIVNPIGCQDCHEPNTMKLRITRPALKEALARRGIDWEKATHNEMRSLVCAQCHVEYYFKGDGKYLTLPWDKGLSVDEMEEYYDGEGFKDFDHKLSRTPVLKAQHPDYELFSTSIHYDRGVSCVDCHMPYKTEGGVKFTNHHITSPLQNIAASCQVCHRQSEEELIHDVYERQERVTEVRRLAEKALAAAHIEAEAAWKGGATEAEMAPVLDLLRHAQWRWDWVAAANSAGFHSPVEALRVLGTSLDRTAGARRMLDVIFSRHNISFPINLPDLSTKEQAQEYIGLKMDEYRADKDELLRTMIPEWDRKARERQGTLISY